MASRADFRELPRSNYQPLVCPYEGATLLQFPRFNKGSAFPQCERTVFKLQGLLPPNIQSLDEQIERAYQQYSSQRDDLAKNTFMASMKAQNEVLYYKLLQAHIKEMFSIIYTPTEGDAIQNYSRLFRKPEGCFLNIKNQDAIHETLSSFANDEVDYIVVSDGEEILGIGDQGVGAILISVAKLVITTLCAGIHPSRQLPVVLDCGTDNEKLLNDSLYLGLRQNRVRGPEYDRFVDKFIQSARRQFPRAYIHFEDFGLNNARRILDRYQDQIACFNDDIQGTGCVTLAAMMAALHVSATKLEDVRVVIFGAGTAGTGIADQIADAIATEVRKSKDHALKHIWCVDKPGLLFKTMGDKLTPAQTPFARDANEWPENGSSDLLSVIKNVKPHVLIGTSTKPKAFTEEIIREMAKYVERPIIFPLSNPTRLHEAIPEDLYEWTNGKSLVATGSPFPPVDYDGKKYEIAECNNSTCFPGIGLGVVLSRSRLLSKKMLVASSEALKAKSPALNDPTGPLLPDVKDVREISVDIAAAVIQCSIEEGLAQEESIPSNAEELKAWIRAQMWEPNYRPLVKGN